VDFDKNLKIVIKLEKIKGNILGNILIYASYIDLEFLWEAR